MFTPVGGVGTTYVDPSTGVTYMFNGGTSWTPISSSASGNASPYDVTSSSYNPGTQTDSSLYGTNTSSSAPATSAMSQTDIQNAINSAIAGVQKPQAVNINPSDFTIPDFNTFVQKAYNDPTVVAYYQQKLSLAQGNVDLAKSYITQDYTTGIRYAQEDAATQSTRATQDFTDAMKSLGLEKLTTEATTEDTQNKRGIALTQTPGGGASVAPTTQFDDQGNPIPAGGEAGLEKGQMEEDFALRSEALARTESQSLADITKGLTRTTENLGTTEQRGLTSQDQSLQDTELSLQQEREQNALTAGGQAQQAAISGAQLGLQAKELGVNVPSVAGVTT